MTHSFLLEPSSWIIKGTWLDKSQKSISFKGAVIITWDQSKWFLMKTKMVFLNSDRPDITFEYKGFLPPDKTEYAYVLKRSDIEKIEGEGWLSNDSIIKRYWVLGDNRRLNGFETYFFLDQNTYHLTGAMIRGNNILNTWEGILERHG